MSDSSNLFHGDEEADREGQQHPGNAQDHELGKLHHATGDSGDEAHGEGPGLFNRGGDEGEEENEGAAGGRVRRGVRKWLDSGGDNGKSGSGKQGGLFNAEGDKKKGGLSKLKKLGSNKLMLGGIGGGVGVVILILILVVVIGSLKLPDIAQSIEGYEFAQASIEFSKTAQSVTDEALAEEAANDGVFAGLKAKYNNLRDGTWGRLDNYRPNRVIKNLGDNNGLELRFRTSKLTGRRIFVGGTINNTTTGQAEDFDVKPVTGIARWTPGVRQIVEFKNKIGFLKSDFWPNLMDTMKANNIGPVIRGAVYFKIMGETGGSLSGWLLSKFAGNPDDEKAQALATQQMDSATDNQANPPPEPPAATEQVAEADDAAQQQSGQDAQSTPEVEKIDANNGDDVKAEAAADAKLNGNLLTSTLKIADVAYAIFVPLCIVYDSSVQQSGPTIDYQMHQQQNAADQLLAEADQQKKGDETAGSEGEFAAAVGGTNNEIGDISGSKAYQRAYGNPQSTDDMISAEAGAGGTDTYSILNALGVPADSLEGKSADWVVGHLCPVLTNTYVATGTALANIIAAIISFGGTEAGEEAAGQGARAFITKFVEHITQVQIEKQGVKSISRGLLNRAMRFAFKQGIVVGGTYGLSELAHLVVASRAGQANNGLAQNKDLIDEVDSGANINNAEIERQLLFGRPLTESEIGQQEQQGIHQLGYENSTKSFTQRYFALDNADSLLTHIGMDLGADAHPGVLASLSSLASNIFRPMNSLGSLVTAMDGAAIAAPAPSSLDFGNVQFGWPASEENLVESNDSYKMLENQAILDASGKEDAIAQKYSICFGDDYNSSGNGDLDPSESGSNLQPGTDASLGTLLSNADIVRDDSGNVVANQGLCSPDNLGANSPDPLAQDQVSGIDIGPNDLILRWRLAMRFDNTVDQLTNEQTATSSPATGGP